MLKIEMPHREMGISGSTVGNRKRAATATAIAFINENLFVSAILNRKTLYLVELTESGHNILQEVHLQMKTGLLHYYHNREAIEVKDFCLF